MSAPPVLERLFWRFELVESGCWLYRGHLSRGGYAQIRVNGKARGRHVVAYETFVGKVPEGLQLDHTCKQRACFNPRHLEPVTAQENVLRSEAWGGINSRKKRCPAGHAYDARNPRGARICRQCRREASLAHYHRKQGASA